MARKIHIGTALWRFEKYLPDSAETAVEVRVTIYNIPNIKQKGTQK